MKRLLPVAELYQDEELGRSWDVRDDTGARGVDLAQPSKRRPKLSRGEQLVQWYNDVPSIKAQ